MSGLRLLAFSCLVLSGCGQENRTQSFLPEASAGTEGTKLLLPEVHHLDQVFESFGVLGEPTALGIAYHTEDPEFNSVSPARHLSAPFSSGSELKMLSYQRESYRLADFHGNLYEYHFDETHQNSHVWELMESPHRKDLP